TIISFIFSLIVFSLFNNNFFSNICSLLSILDSIHPKKTIIIVTIQLLKSEIFKLALLLTIFSIIMLSEYINNANYPVYSGIFILIYNHFPTINIILEKI